MKKEKEDIEESKIMGNPDVAGVFTYDYGTWWDDGATWGTDFTKSKHYMFIKFKKLHPDAVQPMYANPGDACVDLYAVEDAEIHYGETTLVRTGIAIEIPSGYEGIIRPRSSLSKKGVHVNLGTIDSGYRGEILVSMTKLWLYDGVPQAGDQIYVIPKSYKVKKGDKIAQLAIKEIIPVLFTEVDELEGSLRGEGGFGSSGK